VRRCRKPSRLRLSLEVVVLRTESSNTLYSGVAQTWTPYCGASCLAPRGQSHCQRLVGELPENLSMKNPSPDVEVAGVQPHDTHHSPLASSSGHSKWPRGGALSRGTSPRPRLMDPSRMSRIESSEVLVRTIYHIELYTIRYLHMSSRI
jgi:hypothetical protein